MKNDVMPSIVQMEYGVLNALLTEVKETLATDVKMPEVKQSFSVVDLWKIRKSAKSARSMFKG
ncbi:MAG TPA: hypothetical protein VJU78_01330 [Chitinophagaceae bacterium]|nr:hypothetical protein [Chitinophagaceae bacterium]